MEIFANHAHVFPRECRPEGTIEALLELMDRCHITRAVAFAPFVDQVQNLGIDPNEWLAQELERYDNIYGFGTIDPSKPDLAKQKRKPLLVSGSKALSCTRRTSDSI